MTEKKPSGRPAGRPTGGKTGTSSVYKRGEGLGTGKVGNSDYEERRAGAPAPNQPSKGAQGERPAAGSPLGSIGGLGGASTGSSYQNQANYNTRPGGTNPLGGIGGLGGAGGGGGYRPKRNRGGGLIRIIFFVLLIMFVMNMLGRCAGGTSGGGQNGPAPLPTPVSTPTPAPSGNSASVSGHWNPPSTTYTDTNQSSVSTAVASGAREKFTTLKGNGNDVVTMLVYMCGTDLETNYGMATTDLNEMLYANASDKVHILVETGGTRRWKNSVISSSANQRWIVENRSFRALDKNVGKRAMTDPSTLSDFIKWGAANYPADRYILILWDHGGGSIMGYAHDEHYPNDTMTADEITRALKDGGIKFDFVGFDACLMGNMETAIAVEPYADYLLASEETEPGNGWYYTNWLNKLVQNTSTPTTELCKIIVDDFIQASYQYSSRDKTTLSLLDLAEFSGTVPRIFSEFAKEMMTDIKGDNFTQVSRARGSTREFASSTQIDQIDLIHFCKNLGTASASSLASSLQSCVKYNRCNNMTNAYGISIYFPYARVSQVKSAVQVYENLGMDSNYTSAVRSYATMASSGQVVNSFGSNTLFDILGGGSSYSSGGSYEAEDILNLLLGGSGSSSGNYYGDSYSNSYGSGYYGSGYSLYDLLGGRGIADEDSLQNISQFIGRVHVNPQNLVLTQRDDGSQALYLPQSDWDSIQDIHLNVWVDDGQGYIDMGLDSVYEFDDDGGLLMNFNGLWVGINDQAVAYFQTYGEYQDDTHYVYRGYVPALVNNERADIQIEFSPETPNGVITGITKVYDDGMSGKGSIELQDGDTVDFLCDYYDYQGNYQDTYRLGKQIVVDGDLTVTYDELVGVKAIYGYRLTDIYNANLWTPMLSYEN